MKYIPICLSPAALLNLFEGDHGAPSDVLLLLVDEDARDGIAICGTLRVIFPNINTAVDFSVSRFGLGISFALFSFGGVFREFRVRSFVVDVRRGRI